MLKYNYQQSGQVALISLVVMTAISVVVAATISALAISEFTMTRNAVDADACFYAASGGMDDALVQIKKNDEDWSSEQAGIYSPPDYEYLGVTVVRTVETSWPMKNIEVVANKNSTTRYLWSSYNMNTGQVIITEKQPIN